MPLNFVPISMLKVGEVMSASTFAVGFKLRDLA